MTTLVFGSNGQVARELQRAGPDAMYLDRAAVDLTVPEACASAIETHRPGLVINAAAYTAVDRAEEEESLATIINGQAPSAMARACAALGVPLVHISTDYVFEGGGTAAWRPDDTVLPQNAYGKSKLAGEEGIRSAAGVHAILRTSWVVSAHGNNFVKTMLRLGAERDTLTIVADQIGGPTPAKEIAAACLKIGTKLQENPDATGTYHFSGAPDTSWADFARTIFAKAGLECEVIDIPSSDFPTPAKRPLNSRLDCSTTRAVFDIDRPDWREGLDDILNALKSA